jgi:hypothetical protein
LSGSRT